MVGAIIGQVEKEGSHIGRHFVPALSGEGEILVEGQGSDHGSAEDGMHPGDEAGIRIADLGQASK
jgi:hypothetical protein